MHCEVLPKLFALRLSIDRPSQPWSCCERKLDTKISGLQQGVHDRHCRTGSSHWHHSSCSTTVQVVKVLGVNCSKGGLRIWVGSRDQEILITWSKNQVFIYKNNLSNGPGTPVHGGGGGHTGRHQHWAPSVLCFWRTWGYLHGCLRPWRDRRGG